MKEDFLHFVWQFQQFEKKDLQTTEKQAIIILDAGLKNRHAGADFSLAKILIDGIEWVGDVEIHLKASDWLRHQHQNNKNYNSVILHVVWENDKNIYRQDGSFVPTLVLEDKVNLNLLHRYQMMVGTKEKIACAKQFAQVADLQKILMLDRALSQRLENKALFVRELWQTNECDWEETAYQLLAKNLGFKVNAEPFLQLSQRIPHKIIAKHSDNILSIEALLLGVAGFLTDCPEPDEYTQKLQQEYTFLAHKYQLKNRELPVEIWKFARMRPANFPTIRIAQFARLLAEFKNLFSFFIHTDFKQLLNAIQITPSNYWQKHYHLKKTTNQVAGLGKTSAENILINTVVPLLACVAQEKNNQDYLDKAIQYLENLPAEENSILIDWQALGLKVKNAFDSQALIEQYNHLCLPKKCLSCTIGLALLK